MNVTITPGNHFPEEAQGDGFGAISWEAIASILESAGFVDKRTEKIVGFELNKDGVHFVVKKK